MKLLNGGRRQSVPETDFERDRGSQKSHSHFRDVLVACYRTGKRKKQRTKMVVPVRIRLAGANGSFLPAHTLDATENGARLAGIRADVKIDDIIEVQHRHERALFRVVWITALGSEKQIGIQCVEPDTNIWGTEFPQKPDDYEEREL